MSILDHVPSFGALGGFCRRAARAFLGERPWYLLPSLPCLLVGSLLGGALAEEPRRESYGFFLGTALFPWFVLWFGLATLLLVAGLGASHRMLGRQLSLWVATLAAVPAVAPQLIFFGLHPTAPQEVFWRRYGTALRLEWPGAVISTDLFGNDLPWLRGTILEGVQPPVGFAVAEVALLISANLVVWYLLGTAGIRLVGRIARWWKTR